MSGLVYSKTDSGLLVAENAHSVDEQAVARSLREYDPDLRLVPQVVVGDRVGYRVYRYAGPDRPAEFLLYWGDASTGEPWPLSSRLLDKVREQDKNTRGTYLDEDAREKLRREELERAHASATDSVIADTLKSGRTVLRRGVGLRMARDKRRARGEKT